MKKQIFFGALAAAVGVAVERKFKLSEKMEQCFTSILFGSAEDYDTEDYDTEDDLDDEDLAEEPTSGESVTEENADD